jgi:adenosylcobinamide-GDP ribazoletransferase
MKDSRLGTFGVIGLISILFLKFSSLHAIEASTKNMFLVLISGHSISRFITTILLYTHPYVRALEDSKIKPTTKQMDIKSLVISGFFGLLPLCFFENYWVFTCTLPLLLTYWYTSRFFKKWIGGQTGDCAGALQQVSEVVFYLSILVLWKLSL